MDYNYNRIKIYQVFTYIPLPELEYICQGGEENIKLTKS